MCVVEGCSTVKGVIRKGMCPKHYFRMKRHGSTDAPKGTRNGEPFAFLASLVGYRGNECVPWPYGRDGNGYGKLYNGRFMENAHRRVCILAYGYPHNPRSQATHTCGNGHMGCVNPNHLEWGSNSKNQMDRAIHGTSNRGQRHYCNRLTPDQVKEIYGFRGGSATEISRKYGVRRESVRDIWSGKNWSWLTGADPRQGGAYDLAKALDG